MARPKKGTKEGDLATKRWRETVEKRYGGPEGAHKFMQRIGQIGGRNGHTGGFASNRELAREAGRKGGTISRRGPKRELDKYKPAILEMMAQGMTTAKIAEEVNLPYDPVRRLVRELRAEVSQE